MSQGFTSENRAKETGGNLATIAGDTTSLDGKVTTCDTDDVTVSSSALPTGAATSANQTTSIGHLSGIETLLTTIEGNQLSDGHNVTVDNGSGASAVNIQDGGNVISVDDGGSSLTVDGTVAASQSGTWNINNISGTVSLPTGAATAANQSTANGSLSTIAGDTTSLDSKITACNTGAVTVSSSALPTGAATAANQSTANSSLSTIAGDTTSLDGKVSTCDTDDIRQSTHDNLNCNANLQVGNSDASTSNRVPTASAGDVSSLYNGTTALTPKYAAISASSSGNNTLVAAVASKKIRPLSIVLIASDAVTVRFESGAGGTALTGQMLLSESSGFTSGYCPVGHFETAVNTLLNLELSAAVAVAGWLVYVEV